jgi:plastocyanin
MRNLYRFWLFMALLCLLTLSANAHFLRLHLTMAPATRSAGIVSGRVTVQGQLPRPKTINMSAEPNCAKMYSTPPTTEDVVVGQGGTLKNVVVYISAGAMEETALPSQPFPVMQKGCRFTPHVAAVQVNQELQLINEDSTSHNIHPFPNLNREWNKAQPAGTPPLSAKFAREEIIPVKCNIHPWMRSYFVVLKTSHFSVTGENGAFTMNDLTPGKYTITAWHETYGTQTQEVTITENETTPTNFVFKAR